MDAINQRLRAMARDQRTDRTHHFGVTMANLAYNSIIQDRLQDAAREVEEALDAFESASGLMERAVGDDGEGADSRAAWPHPASQRANRLPSRC